MQEGPILRVPEVQNGDQERLSSLDAPEQEARAGGPVLQRSHATLRT
jgi:hypothetical protein